MGGLLLCLEHLRQVDFKTLILVKGPESQKLKSKMIKRVNRYVARSKPNYSLIGRDVGGCGCDRKDGRIAQRTYCDHDLCDNLVWKEALRAVAKSQGRKSQFPAPTMITSQTERNQTSQKPKFSRYSLT